MTGKLSAIASKHMLGREPSSKAGGHRRKMGRRGGAVGGRSTAQQEWAWRGRRGAVQRERDNSGVAAQSRYRYMVKAGGSPTQQGRAGNSIGAAWNIDWGNGMRPAKGAVMRNAWRGGAGRRAAGADQRVHGTRESAPKPGIIFGAAAAGRRAGVGARGADDTGYTSRVSDRSPGRPSKAEEARGCWKVQMNSGDGRIEEYPEGYPRAPSIEARGSADGERPNPGRAHLEEEENEEAEQDGNPHLDVPAVRIAPEKSRQEV
ncbi:hypothetical protein K438DRAFT_1783151 [Mycena galopus ATCC 62051]|nr:hypothetical protein K438DRAFT_1783151 [Mycena galopus ATCC 62051]